VVVVVVVVVFVVEVDVVDVDVIVEDPGSVEEVLDESTIVVAVAGEYVLNVAEEGAEGLRIDLSELVAIEFDCEVGDIAGLFDEAAVSPFAVEGTSVLEISLLLDVIKFGLFCSAPVETSAFSLAWPPSDDVRTVDGLSESATHIRKYTYRADSCTHAANCIITWNQW